MSAFSSGSTSPSFVKIPGDLPPGVWLYQKESQLPVGLEQVGLWGMQVYVIETRRLYQPAWTYGWMKSWDLMRDYAVETDDWEHEFELNESGD